MFFSLFLLSNNFNLLKINLFDDGHEHNFSIDTLQIEKANAFDEINDTRFINFIAIKMLKKFINSIHIYKL